MKKRMMKKTWVMGEQDPIDDGDPSGRQKAPLDPEISEVEIEGETYKKHHP